MSDEATATAEEVAPAGASRPADSPDSVDSSGSPESTHSPESSDSSDVAGSAGSAGSGSSAATETTAGSTEAAADRADSSSDNDEPRGNRRRPEDVQHLEQEGDIAADYLEELLDIADLDGDIDLDVEGDRAAVSVVGEEVGHLVGEGGEVLEALQELTRLAVHRETGQRSRLMLDVAGYRAQRRNELVSLANTIIEKVRASGEVARLDPMTPFERKIVHDAVAEAELVSESEGEEPERRVVVRPA